MTEQLADTKMTDDEVIEAIASIKKQAKSHIGGYVYYELLGQGYISGIDQLRHSNTFLAELYGDINEFLMTYRPSYDELFGLDTDSFDIINEHFATMGDTADDLVDYLDDIFVTEFVDKFAELADYPSESAKLSAGQFVGAVFETLEENQGKVTKDEVIADGLVTIYIRVLLNHAEQIDNLTKDDIKTALLDIINDD